ncbi:hypothetical protein ACJ41O_008616 [Fusarium nematophilum]
MFYLYHRLGTQSNILVSARYVPNGSTKLSRDTVAAALLTVVEVHPRLRIVSVRRPSSNRGKHQLHNAVLHRIDLDSAGPEFFEKVHNQWDWTDDGPTRPWWKVYVLDGRDAVFIFHHGLADGASGMTFHRTFLRALNAMPAGGPGYLDSTMTLDPATAEKPPDAIFLCDTRYSILELIWTHLKHFMIRLFFGWAMLFAHLPPAKPLFVSITDTASPEQRTVTRVSSLRIQSAKMDKILAACRQRGATFTPLLIVMFLVTFSFDMFPGAKIGRSRFAFDVRPLIRRPKVNETAESDGTIMIGGAGGDHTHWLPKYRRVMAAGLNKKSGRGAGDAPSVNVEEAQRLARHYRRLMRDNIPSRWMRGVIACKLQGDDLEDFVDSGFPAVERIVSRTLLVSSLGAFAAAKSREEVSPRWKIEDVQFSAPRPTGIRAVEASSSTWQASREVTLSSTFPTRRGL